MAELLKHVFDKKLVTLLACEIKNEYAEFNKNIFIENILNKEWKNKELKQRIRHIVENIHNSISKSYKKQINILKPVSTKFSGLEHLIFPDFVEIYGIDDLQTSIKAMQYFTEKSSSEFPVRQFIIKYEKEMMKQMHVWSKSSNEHHRRLSSEGCRPRLPWAVALPKFKQDPHSILPLLNRLKKDESEYVRKSVANNLNDISKDNPQVVVDIAQKWFGNNSKTDWVVKHGCRTLLKSGNVKILNLFGFLPKKDIKVTGFKVTKEINLGGEIYFEFLLKNKNKKIGKVRLEYVIEFVRKKGRTTKKVFKISEGDYPETEKQIIKKHSFKKISTRQYYPGKHKVSLIVNGIERDSKTFLIS